MNFRDAVENSRPGVASKQTKQKQICDFVIKEAKKAIIEQAKKQPKDGTLLKIDGEVYLGTMGDEFMKHIVNSSSYEIKSFFSFLSSKKTIHTTYSLSPDGEVLLKEMQLMASKEGFIITGYKIGFGDTARSDNDDIDTYVGGVRLTNLFMVHKHLLPAEVRHTDFDLSSYFCSPETNGAFERHLDYRVPGLYVHYQYRS